MKAKLFVVDRITLLGVLPAESNLMTLRIIRELKSRVGFSAEDIKTLEIVVDDKEGRATWNNEKDLGIEFTFSDVEVDVISKGLKKLDKDEKLTEQHLHLCELFCK